MNPSPNREVIIFSAALELPASQRAVYLDNACADDPALRLRLKELLRVHEEAITFLENKAPGAQESPIAAEVPGATIRITSAPSEKAGDHIGRYKLLQQIGEGGCGVVYMAEQARCECCNTKMREGFHCWGCSANLCGKCWDAHQYDDKCPEDRDYDPRKEPFGTTDIFGSD